MLAWLGAMQGSYCIGRAGTGPSWSKAPYFRSCFRILKAAESVPRIVFDVICIYSV